MHHLLLLLRFVFLLAFLARVDRGHTIVFVARRIVGELFALETLCFLIGVVPAAFDERLQDHGVGGEDVGGDEGELVRLVVVVRVGRRVHGILDQLLECPALAHELNEFGNAAAAAKHDEFVLLEQELFNGATLLLVQKLVDLHVASEKCKTKQVRFSYKRSANLNRLLSGERP